MLHNNSDLNKLYLFRPNKESILLNITDLHKTPIVTFSQYLQRLTAKIMMLTSTWQAQRAAKSIHWKALIEQLQIDPNDWLEPTKLQIKTSIKMKRLDQQLNTIKEKKCVVNILQP